MEGARISWDELTCVGYPVSEEATEKLCLISKSSEESRNVRTFCKERAMINWKILKQSEGQLLATNAYALLTSDYFSFSKTQCAVFKEQIVQCFWIRENLQDRFTHKSKKQ